MAKIEEFLSSSEEVEIIEAIQKAEKATSGEIRVHIENEVVDDPISHAEKVFYSLKMENTKDRNGVLIYMAVQSKVFVIYGDKGINDAVPEGFWDGTKDVMQAHFKEKMFKDGIVEGIEKAGEQLKKFFPWTADDKNELSDEISKS